jgi:hypothetical protein
MGISREEYLKLSDLCPTIDPNKVEVFEVVLFFCDFIESKILSVNNYVNWEENHTDKEQILYVINVTRQYNDRKVPFEKLIECKYLVKDPDECNGVINLYKIWQMVWPFTFDFLNDKEENSWEWFYDLDCYILHINISLWHDFVDMVKERFNGRFLE